MSISTFILSTYRLPEATRDELRKLKLRGIASEFSKIEDKIFAFPLNGIHVWTSFIYLDFI